MGRGEEDGAGCGGSSVAIRFNRVDLIRRN